jgi:hypothetical protein
VALVLVLPVSCRNKGAQSVQVPAAPLGTAVSFTLASPSGPPFFGFPWPSDLRLADGGGPDLSTFPVVGNNALVANLLAVAQDRQGFPMTPTAYFLFDGGLNPALSLDAGAIPASASQQVLLVDVDPAAGASPFLPVVAAMQPADSYTPANLLAISPVPGIVLLPKHTYAFVVRRELNDAAGHSLGVPQALWDLENEATPTGANGVAAFQQYKPLWTVLKAQGIPPTDVAAATVFTTGDVVQDLATLSSNLMARDPVTIGVVGVPTDGGGVHEGFCEISGTATFPQYQQGTPPFNTGGVFQTGPDGLPLKQGAYTDVPFVLTFPSGPMPEAGYPLVLYFHGSGGVSREVIDRGPQVEVDAGVWVSTPGEGPAWVLAPYGFAAAGAALPLNPERVPGASETEYLNLNNLAAFRDTFRQGVVEQRMLLAALNSITFTLASSDLAQCGITLPAGQTALHYDAKHLYAQGQSMGGMYANLVTAVEPDLLGAVPTGAGGYWAYFILNTQQVNGQQLIPDLISGVSPAFTWQHPVLDVLEYAWEPADPVVYAARLGRRPLPGYPVRPVYEPVGSSDSFFNEPIYDAMALSYGNKQAAAPPAYPVVWTSMQGNLALEGISGVLEYPVTNDLASATGASYTGVVAQYVDPTGDDGHYIFTQVPGVMHQYACFLSTLYQTGTATVVTPGPVGSPCE